MHATRSGALLSLLALLAAAAPPALAQSYPTRPIRLVVPSAPGGGTDLSARTIAPKLSERLGQQVVVDNRGGGGSIIGNEIVAHAPADGYTLLMGISTLAILPSMYSKLPYDTLKDIAPISVVVAVPNALTVHPSVPARSVKEVIALARSQPGAINYASAGPGTNPHLAAELFKAMTKTDIVHVPYKGSGPAVIGLIAGETAMSFASLPSIITHVKAGRLRPLALTTAKRSGALPDLPTIAEAGVPGYEAQQWFALAAPGNTPRPIIERLHKALMAALRDPEVVGQFGAQGAVVVGNTPEEFGAYLRSELDKWARVIRDAGIKPMR
jgi:tripartite-type tricarboxylate transporter receptor subunit TctC